MALFAVQHLTFAYPEAERPVLSDLSLEIRQGEFHVLCGPSGCGKSTLLRQLKTVLAPAGTRSGEILFQGTPLEQVDQRTQSRKIGFVQQSPENQIVTDKVWHELAFGLESLGCPTEVIRRRTAETASFFGIESWFHRSTAELSGGQKQLLNLAAVMVMQPEILILDEPTGQLDPIAAADFLAALERVNREVGTTVLLTEHRLEEALTMAGTVSVLEGGRLLYSGSPGAVGQALWQQGAGMFAAMPAAMRIWAAVKNDAPCPVTLQEGRAWLADFAREHPLRPVPEAPAPAPGETLLRGDGLWFRYEREGTDVLRGLSLQAGRGELLALLGGNGSGKTTLLRVLAGTRKPWRGSVSRQGVTALLPQDPGALFVKKTLGEDLAYALRNSGLSPEEQGARIRETAALCRLGGLLGRHPYDLSGGERQRAALARVLLGRPEVLLLDEPTKGMDAAFKITFAGILQTLLAQGAAIVMVSHDLEFCARYAHRCAMVFDGTVISQAPPRDFFSENAYYTTAANRIARPLLPRAVTAEDVIRACGGAVPEEPLPPEGAEPETPVLPEKTPPLPVWRKWGAVISGAAALGLFLYTAAGDRLSAVVTADGMTALSRRQLGLYALLLAALTVFAGMVSRRSRRKGPPPAPPARQRLARRTAAALAMLLLLIPVTLYVGVFRLEKQDYLWVALAILAESMLPFFLIYEGRRPQARELVVIAVLCALGVAGRAAFFMLPQFKPVLAITIVSGVALGGESGFLVGAMTMLASNILFAQGPWTPWQMFAMGIIGFLAGVLFRKGLLAPSREALSTFGVLSAVVIYGGIVNLASALMWTRELTVQTLLTYYLTGFPMDCVHAAATGLFLWFAAEPMLEKLERIKVKYGLME